MSWKVIEILKGIRSSIGSQEVIKSSWKILQRSDKIRSSGLPKFLKGSRKSTKFKKMHKRYPRSSDLRFSTDPQNVLKFLKSSSKPSKSSEVHKRYSRRPQFLKMLSTSSKSSVGNQVRKILNVLKSHWNPQRHQVLNRFTRSHQKFLKDSSTFW